MTLRHHLPFCVACFLAALGIGFLVTQTAPGISPDSILYIDIAENILDKGLLEVVGAAKFAGPLYPILIAAFTYLGFSIEGAAEIIPILSFALLMFPMFYLGKTIWNSTMGYLACIICLAFTPSLIVLASFIWTDMPALLMSTAALLFLVKYTKSHGTAVLFLSGLFVALAILFRLMSVALLIVGFATIVIENRHKLQFRRMAWHILVFGSLSGFLALLWFTQYSSTLAKYEPFQGANLAALVENLSYGLKMMLYYFLPGLSFNNIFLCVALTATAGYLILLAAYGMKGLRAFVGHITDFISENQILLLYILIYFTFVTILTSVVWDYGVTNRYFTQIYPFILITAVAFAIHLYRSTAGKLRLTIALMIIPMCLLFFPLQAHTSATFCQKARLGQEVNDPYWREHEGLGWIRENVREDWVVYTDLKYRYAIDYHLPNPTQQIQNYFHFYLRPERDYAIITFHNIPIYLPSELRYPVSKKAPHYGFLTQVGNFKDCTIWVPTIQAERFQ